MHSLGGNFAADGLRCRLLHLARRSVKQRIVVSRDLRGKTVVTIALRERCELIEDLLHLHGAGAILR